MSARNVVVLAALAALAACSDRSTPTSPAAPESASFSRGGDDRDSDGVGAVFVTTNDATANAVVAFSRDAEGALTLTGRTPTGGRGIGGTVDPLASQFALTLSENSQTLFVVNAGSNDVSSFAVDGSSLTLRSRVTSGGIRPVSVASGQRALYVLNAESSTISVIRVNNNGALAASPVQTIALGAGARGAATIRLSRNGRLLAVTARVSNTIDSYVVERDGTLSGGSTIASAGNVPFGFDYTPRGQIIVSEAGSRSTSSYQQAKDGTLHIVSGAVPTLQLAPCWVIVDNGGRFAYVVNSGSGSISAFAIDADGSLSLAPANVVAGFTGTGSQPLDVDLSRDGKFLYALENGTGTVGVLRTNADGSLTALADAPGLEARAGFMGIAA